MLTAKKKKKAITSQMTGTTLKNPSPAIRMITLKKDQGQMVRVNIIK